MSFHKLPASQSVPEVKRTLLDPACSPFSTLAYTTPVLLSPCSGAHCSGALGAPPPTPPQAGPQDCARFVRSDSFQVRLILHGASLQAARPRSDVCVCPSSWGRLSSSHFPKSTTTPMGKWGTVVYLGTGGGGLWSTSTMTLYPSFHLVKISSLVWRLRPSVN